MFVCLLFPIHFNAVVFYLLSIDNYIIHFLLTGHSVAQLVEALRYKSEGRGFDPR